MPRSAKIRYLLRIHFGLPPFLFEMVEVGLEDERRHIYIYSFLFVSLSGRIFSSYVVPFRFALCWLAFWLVGRAGDE